MEKRLIVHTRAKPGTVLPEESRILDVPDVEFALRGPCATPAQVSAALCDADAGLCGSEPYTREVFAAAPKLKVVVRYGIGVDTVDLNAATEAGVLVANFPDFCIEEVANHALVLVLACAKKVVQLDRTLRSKGWAAARELMSPMGPIHDQTLGLVAFGNIARALAKRAKALNMQVIAHDPFVAPEVFAEAGVERVTLEELAARSDYVSCHLPLTPGTKGLLNAAFFARMKPAAYFVNTGRGPVVVEPDLVAALREGRIAGAGLDVFEVEPLPQDHPFLSMENVILLPHTASYADATFQALYRRVAQAALAVVRGGVPEFVANPEVIPHRRK